jgi:hypothetical protein
MLLILRGFYMLNKHFLDCNNQNFQEIYVPLKAKHLQSKLIDIKLICICTNVCHLTRKVTETFKMNSSGRYICKLSVQDEITGNLSAYDG